MQFFGKTLSFAGSPADVIAVLLLPFAAYYGGKRGLLGLAAGFFGLFSAVLAATALCGPASALIGEKLQLKEAAARFFEARIDRAAYDVPMGEITREKIVEALTDLRFPRGVAEAVAGWTEPFFERTYASASLTGRRLLIETLTKLSLLAAAWIVVFIAAAVLAGLVKTVSSGVNAVPVAGAVNRILGAAVCSMTTYAGLRLLFGAAEALF